MGTLHCRKNMQKPIPSIKSILDTHNTLAKKDTFNLTKGHLAAIDHGKSTKSKVISTLPQNWSITSSPKEVLPRISSSLHFQQVDERSPVAPKNFSRSIDPDPEYTTQGLTKTENFSKSKLKTKSVGLKLPSLSENHTVFESAKVLRQLAIKNKTYGEVLMKIHDGYIEYLRSISVSSNLKSRHQDLDIEKETETTIEDYSKQLHSLEDQCFLLGKDIKSINDDIELEKQRVKTEKAHFDKFRFLHHDKPVFKAKPFKLVIEDLSETEQMNLKFHETIEIITKADLLETEMKNKKESSEMVLKSELERDSLALNELIHENGVLEETSSDLLKKQLEIQDSLEFFVKSIDDPSVIQEYQI